MNRTTEQDKCISYFDLLGTKAAAQQSQKQYEKLIREFRDAIDGATNEFASSKDKIWAFSDCAYVQTENEQKMFDFYQKLRECLIPNSIFFTAAMDIGELKTLPPIKDVVSAKRNRENVQSKSHSSVKLGAFFVGTDTTRIYAQQSALTGIGITCGQQLLPKYRQQLCLSYYYSTQDCTKLAKFWDLEYEAPSIIMLESVVAQLVKTRFENMHASRYYLSAVVSILKSFDIAQLEDQELWEIVICCSLGNPFFGKIKNSFKTEINIFIVTIIQLLLDNMNRVDNLNDKIRNVISIAEMDAAQVVTLYHDNLIRQVIEPDKQSQLLDRLLSL